MHRWAAVMVSAFAAVCALAACGGSGRPVRLDQQAVSVADTFTKLAWNKHDCQAGNRYLIPGACPPKIPAGTFPLRSHRIQPNSCGHGPQAGSYSISPGCIKYTASNGDTLEYDMTKTRHGWRIIETGTGSP
jgi:hypothetical protein